VAEIVDTIWSWIVKAVGETSWRELMPLGLAGILVWGLWLYRAVLSRFARPVLNNFRTSVSVVVPAYREDPDILLECLESWLSQDPDEVIIVPDVEDHEVLRRLRAVADPRVRVLAFEHRGKRSALGVGIRAARCEIVVLADSDTRWQPGLLAAVQMPFIDPNVGGVGTQQNVYMRQSSVWRRVADWLVNLRYYDYVPAMGRAGAVACLSGRTAAYRREAILPVLSNLENEFFLGRRCVAGDDGRLTWLVLASGYKTVHQSSARALSMFPTGLSAFVKQRVRWSRNSYRTYFTALYKGWLWRVPLVTKVTVLQILLTPVTMGMALGYLLLSRLELTGRGVVLVLIWLLVGRGIRGYSHLRRHPFDVLLLPLLAVVVIGISLPIKLWALITMNKQGWLTRSSDKIGGEGQGAASLGAARVRSEHAAAQAPAYTPARGANGVTHLPARGAHGPARVPEQVPAGGWSGGGRGDRGDHGDRGGRGDRGDWGDRGDRGDWGDHGDRGHGRPHAPSHAPAYGPSHGPAHGPGHGGPGHGGPAQGPGHGPGHGGPDHGPVPGQRTGGRRSAGGRAVVGSSRRGSDS
jgi:N-acetylglucosaminyltransferase